jgi:hypothetical protein
MAKEPIKGKNVAFMVEKPAGSGTYVRVGCVGDISLSIDTSSDDVDCVDSGTWEESIPGTIGYTAEASLTARTISGADADTNMSLAEFIALQFSQTIFKLRFDLDADTRYGGDVYITKGGIKSQNKGAATGSVSLKGTGPLALVP